MLFVSERSWKHHYVTLLLPYTYLMYRVGMPGLTARVRATLASGLVLSALLMATTSSELGGWFAHGQGHKLAQGYGMFLWAGVVLYIPTAWRVRVEGRRVTGEDSPRGSTVGRTIRAPDSLGGRDPRRALRERAHPKDTKDTTKGGDKRVLFSIFLCVLRAFVVTRS